jgi:multiple sugar transport system substrate-binding protein
MKQGKKVDQLSAVGEKKLTRRSFLKGVGSVGLGMAAMDPLGKLVSAAAPKGPVKLTFWGWQNPQQQVWMLKRVNMYMQKNPNVKIDFQYFTFTDLGKKIVVGFATGTAPDGFATGDWMMPTWFARNLIAPLDIKLLGYSSMQAYVDDYPKAYIDGAVKDGKVYGFPVYFYGFLNYLNVKQFKEAGLDADKDQPQTWEQLGQVAKKLAIKKGDKFERQGFKFAMHAANWTMVQFNPILSQCGGAWFDKSGKCTLNSEAGVKAMTIRASLTRQFGAEDPADTIATSPLPMLDFLKERSSMFITHVIPPPVVKSQNPAMEGHLRPVQVPGVTADKRYTTAYGFNLCINNRISKEKQEVLHDLFRFIMSDPGDCWEDTKPFTPARKSGWTDDPRVRDFPYIKEIIAARDHGALLPRTVVYNELADIVHEAVQKVMLTNADIKATLDWAASQVDKATEESKKSS